MRRDTWAPPTKEYQNAHYPLLMLRREREIRRGEIIGNWEAHGYENPEILENQTKKSE
jgi:hypothetical protein